MHPSDGAPNTRRTMIRPGGNTLELNPHVERVYIAARTLLRRLKQTGTPPRGENPRRRSDSGRKSYVEDSELESTSEEEEEDPGADMSVEGSLSGQGRAPCLRRQDCDKHCLQKLNGATKPDHSQLLKAKVAVEVGLDGEPEVYPPHHVLWPSVYKCTVPTRSLSTRQAESGNTYVVDTRTCSSAPVKNGKPSKRTKLPVQTVGDCSGKGLGAVHEASSIAAITSVGATSTKLAPTITAGVIRATGAGNGMLPSSTGRQPAMMLSTTNFL